MGVGVGDMGVGGGRYVWGGGWGGRVADGELG